MWLILKRSILKNAEHPQVIIHTFNVLRIKNFLSLRTLKNDGIVLPYYFEVLKSIVQPTPA